jgi:regulatory protein
MPDLGTIAEIKPKGRSARRYEVWVDGEVALEADKEVIAEGGLRPGQPLTGEEVAALRKADQALEASRLTLGLLAHRARSRHELLLALRRKRYPQEIVELTMQRLERAGLLDDEAFARQMVETFSRRRLLGRYAVYHKLRQAGLDEAVAEQALAAASGEDDELERARLVARKYLDRPSRSGETPGPRLRAKVYDLLQRRGYEAGIARQVTEETVGDDRIDDL